MAEKQHELYKRQIEACESWLQNEMNLLSALPTDDKRKAEMRANISNVLKSLGEMKAEIPPSPPKLPVYVVSVEGQGTMLGSVVGAYLRRDKAVDAARRCMKEFTDKDPKKGAFKMLDDDMFDDSMSLEVWYRGEMMASYDSTRVKIQQYNVEP